MGHSADMVDETPLGQKRTHGQPLGNPAPLSDSDEELELQRSACADHQHQSEEQDACEALNRRLIVRAKQPPLQPPDPAPDENHGVRHATIEPGRVAKRRVDDHC